MHEEQIPFTEYLIAMNLQVPSLRPRLIRRGEGSPIGLAIEEIGERVLYRVDPKTIPFTERQRAQLASSECLLYLQDALSGPIHTRAWHRVQREPPWWNVPGRVRAANAKLLEEKRAALSSEIADYALRLREDAYSRAGNLGQVCGGYARVSTGLQTRSYASRARTLLDEIIHSIPGESCPLADS